MTLPVATVTAVAFPSGVASVTLAGTLLGVGLITAAPNATCAVLVAMDQSGGTEYVPLMVGGRPVILPVGQGYCSIPLEAQALPAKIQLQFQNYGGAAGSALVVTSA